MTSEADMNYRWCKWVFEGKGKDSGNGGGEHFYRDRVKYYGSWPRQRWVKSYRNGEVLLVRHVRPNDPACDDSRVGMKTIDGYAHGHTRIIVDDLGVFSKYPGDMVEDDKLHERQEFIMVSKVRHFVMEELPSITGDQFEKPWHRWSQEDGTTLDHYRAWLKKQQEVYFDYSYAFGLYWNGIPQMYFDRFEEVVAAKLRKYNDPKAVAQRERTNARRLAKQALGLNKG